jgi:hypothetical protein
VRDEETEVKGIIFTEFLEMVEDQFTPEVADRIISAAALPADGAYTAVGTYDYRDMVQLVAQLSTVTGIAVPDLLRAFGTYLFQRFVATYPYVFEGVTSAFAFLERIEGHIHAEVRKLYPDAELPALVYNASIPGRLTMLYRSARPFADLAEGLLVGCIEHFGERLTVHKEDLSDGQGTCARFLITERN